MKPVTSILVIESNRRAREDLLGVLPETVDAIGAEDIVDAEECMDEAGPFDTFVVQGAMQDGKSPGDIRVTLSFLRHLSATQPSAKVFVLSNMFDHGPTVGQYETAFVGCIVLNKESVLNGATVLPI